MIYFRITSSKTELYNQPKIIYFRLCILKYNFNFIIKYYVRSALIILYIIRVEEEITRVQKENTPESSILLHGTLVSSFSLTMPSPIATVPLLATALSIRLLILILSVLFTRVTRSGALKTVL